MVGRRHLLRPVRQGRADAARWSRSMAPNPIIFAMANPDPEITPEDARQARDDVIIATGRSDYPNQVNNVLGFPYIFRGALDVRAKTINMEMKIAAAHALAELAREDVPDEVAAAYRGARPRFGRDYIIPVAVRSAPHPRRSRWRSPRRRWTPASRAGPIVDMNAYKAQLSARRDPIAGAMQRIVERVRRYAQARRLRRGRGGAGHSRRLFLRQPGPRHGDPGRARGSRARGRRGSRLRSRGEGHRNPQRAAVARATRSTRSSSTSGCSGADSCSATASA